MPSFGATELSIAEGHDFLVTTLRAPSTDEDDFYLMAQRKVSPHSARDVAWGRAQPYTEWCGQGWSWFGHIESFELSRQSISVWMDSDAAGHMRNDGQLHVSFDLDDLQQYTRLRSALRRTFQGCRFYSESP